MIVQIVQALFVSAGLFWEAFWALAFGYAFSSLIQVLVPCELVARYLGRSGARETLLAMLLGPASSSCSFAALSAGRALFAKGAALIPMLAFLFGATNLGARVRKWAADVGERLSNDPIENVYLWYQRYYFRGQFATYRAFEEALAQALPQAIARACGELRATLVPQSAPKSKAIEPL